MAKTLTKSAPARKQLRISEFKTLDSSQGTFEGYLSVFGNIDSYKDVVDPGSFTKTISDAEASRRADNSDYLFPILWQHNPHEPIGGFIDMHEDQKGLFVKGQLDLDVELGRRAFSGLSKGYLRGLSIGYDAIKEGWQKDIRHLKEIRLWEGSVVTFPANTAAQITGAKSVKDSAGGLSALVSLVSSIDYYTDALSTLTDQLIDMLGLPDPDDPGDSTADKDVSPAVQAIMSSLPDLAKSAAQVDSANDTAATAADNLMALLDIPDNDGGYGEDAGYMDGGLPDFVKALKAGKKISSANHQAIADGLDKIKEGHKNIADVLESVKPAGTDSDEDNTPSAGGGKSSEPGNTSTTPTDAEPFEDLDWSFLRSKKGDDTQTMEEIRAWLTSVRKPD